MIFAFCFFFFFSSRRRHTRCSRDWSSDVCSSDLGETSKISYATYISHRLSGFEGDSPRPTPRDLDDYPSFRDRLVARGASPTYRRPVCTGPVAVRNLAPLESDIARLKQSLVTADVTDAFMTAVSPGTIAVFHPNEYYRTHEEY